MSVRTAWEIAALEDVRLAFSPRQQQQPAAARPAQRPPSHPSRPSRGPRRCRQGQGRGAAGRVFLSSRLLCSFPPLLPLAGRRWAGAGSLVAHPTRAHPRSRKRLPRAWVMSVWAGARQGLCRQQSQARQGPPPLPPCFGKPSKPGGEHRACSGGRAGHRATRKGCALGWPALHPGPACSGRGLLDAACSQSGQRQSLVQDPRAQTSGRRVGGLSPAPPATQAGPDPGLSSPGSAVPRWLSRGPSSPLPPTPLLSCQCLQ